MILYVSANVLMAYDGKGKLTWEGEFS